jgi:tRNA(fMet)-specific endonuclease VapC
VNEFVRRIGRDPRHKLRQAGTPIPENDIWIAALAMEYGLPILSDDRHFDRVNQVRRIAWSGSTA